MITECREINQLCKYMKKVRSSQATILVLNWVKLGFSLWVPLIIGYASLMAIEEILVLFLSWCSLKIVSAGVI